MDVSEHASLLPAGLIAAYRAARYQVGQAQPFVLTVDAQSPELAALLRAESRDGAVFLSAWNPFGVEKSRTENDARQALLAGELRDSGLRAIAGFGSDPAGCWSGEASVLVLGLDRAQACELGRRYQQNAILWAGADAIPRLLLLR